LDCAYCRQSIDCISLNNEEEKENIIKEFCTTHKKFSLFDPITIEIYNDLYNVYTNVTIDLYGNIINENNENNENNELNELIVIYPIIATIILFIYACFMISIDKDIVKRLIHFLVIVFGIWYVLYSLMKRFHNLNVAECYFIGWISLIIVGTLFILY